jgi:hypothetical protein
MKLTRAKFEQLVDDLLQKTSARPSRRCRRGRRPVEDRRGRARRRLDAHPEGAADRQGAVRQGAAQGRQPGRSRRGRRGDPGRRARRRRQGPAAARRHAAVARHRDARRRDDDADPAQHDDPDAQERDRSRPRRQPDERRSARAAGRAPLARDNRTLGKFHLVGLPPAPRGVPQIEVTFDIDANGIVNVSAKDSAPARSRRSPSPRRAACKDEVDRMMKEAESHADEDSTNATASSAEMHWSRQCRCS